MVNHHQGCTRAEVLLAAAPMRSAGISLKRSFFASILIACPRSIGREMIQNPGGERHETSPPKLSATRRGRRRGAGHSAIRLGADLSDAAGPNSRRHRRRWRARHPRPLDRAMALRAARPAIRRREPAGRRQQYRDRSGRARGPGRLHAPLGRPDGVDQRDAL
jgi:hypothetical protein